MTSCSMPTKEEEEEKEERESITGPNWLDLPTEVTENILRRLCFSQIASSACQVCSQWRNICMDPLMWRTIDMSFSSINGCIVYDDTFFYAIDRSRGLLENINIEYFGTNHLLEYLAERASNIRRMRLAYCSFISDKGLKSLAKKLVLLEAIDISYNALSEDSLEVIGRSCPRLKSLKFSRDFSKNYKSDVEAFAIAKTMPKLRYLKIFGNTLTNIGLIAILDGCHLLESLDLRCCFNLDLSGSLGQRCLQQIKGLKLPTSDDDKYIEDGGNSDDDGFFSWQRYATTVAHWTLYLRNITSCFQAIT